MVKQERRPIIRGGSGKRFRADDNAYGRHKLMNATDRANLAETSRLVARSGIMNHEALEAQNV
jgi:hypothetical protein